MSNWSCEHVYDAQIPFFQSFTDSLWIPPTILDASGLIADPDPFAIANGTGFIPVIKSAPRWPLRRSANSTSVNFRPEP